MTTGIGVGLYGAVDQAAQTTLLVTPGAVVGPAYAYQTGVYGSIAPDRIGPREMPILQLFSGNTGGTSGYDFFVCLDLPTGTYAQNLFAGLVIEDRTGALRAYDTASATFFTLPSSNQPVWRWGTGSNHLWNNTTARRVFFL